MSGTVTLQEVMDFHVIGHSMPLTRTVFILTGAVPLTIATLPMRTTDGLTEKVVEKIWDAILMRAESSQPLMAAVFSTLSPFATKALYLASISGAVLLTVNGPLTNSCSARKYIRRKVGLASILASLPSAELTRNKFWPGAHEPLLPRTMLKSNIISE